MRPAFAHVLYLHGNGGNIGDRAPHVERLAAAGLDVLIFDYRGYGRSSGRPSEEGTHRDAAAAREAVLGRRDADARRLIYLGERSEEHTSELQSRQYIVCRLLLEKKTY